MDHWPNVTIEDWDQFENFVGELPPSVPYKPRFVFRGQSVFSWPLNPSFCRHVPDSFPPDRLGSLEIQAVLEFIKKAHIFLDSKFLPDVHNLIEWFHLMQHYSAPTRLLDWTFSPYLALYFAVDQNFEQDGAVWSFDRTELTSGMRLIHGEQYRFFDDSFEEKKHKAFSSYYADMLEYIKQYGAFLDSDAPNMIFLYEPEVRSKASERIIVQQGTFTYSKAVLGKHDEGIHEAITKVCEKVPADSRTRYAKLQIPKKVKKEFLQKLYTMNINPSALFPGIDGLGRSIAGFININANWFLTHEHLYTGRKPEITHCSVPQSPAAQEKGSGTDS